MWFLGRSVLLLQIGELVRVALARYYAFSTRNFGVRLNLLCDGQRLIFKLPKNFFF